MQFLPTKTVSVSVTMKGVLLIARHSVCLDTLNSQSDRICTADFSEFELVGKVFPLARGESFFERPDRLVFPSTSGFRNYRLTTFLDGRILFRDSLVISPFASVSFNLADFSV